MVFANVIGIFRAIIYILNILAFCFSNYVVNSLEAPAPRHPLYTVDWTNMLPSDSFVLFRVPTRIFYRGVPGFATDFHATFVAVD